MILAFIDEMRVEGYAVESSLLVLRQQGLSIAARTYRSWKQPTRIAVRTVTDALVEDKNRTTIPGPDGKRAGELLNRDFTAPAPNLV